MSDRLAYIDVTRDGISRTEAYRRLLVLAEEETRLYAPSTWVRRLWAVLGVLAAFLRRRG